MRHRLTGKRSIVVAGSAAFNLLCITAVCVVTIPSPGVSRIEQTMVFAVTSAFCVFAYVWLLIVLVLISPNQVEVWEGTMTLFFMVVLVVSAYLADIRICDKFRKKGEESVEMAASPEKEALRNGEMQDFTPIDDKLAKEQKHVRFPTQQTECRK
jgi:solute carrier family 8 (sodium/calcium exchanger)